MASGPWLLHRFSGAWNVRKLEQGRSLLVFTYNFKLRFGLLGRLLQPVAARWFSHDMGKRLLAIKRFLEARSP